MRRALMAASMMMAAIVSGCIVDRPIDQEIDDVRTPPDVDTERAYRPIRGAVDGRLIGEIGPVTGVDRDANLLSAYDDGYYMSVETVVELEDRAVMTLLSVSNGAEIFQPGLDARFTLDNFSNDGIQVTLLGCVGQDVGVYDEYDSPADEVSVEVDAGETDDEMVVDVQAVWYDRDVTTGERLTTFKAANTSFTLLR